jgi:hypothetical protein
MFYGIDTLNVKWRLPLATGIMEGDREGNYNYEAAAAASVSTVTVALTLKL